MPRDDAAERVGPERGRRLVGDLGRVRVELVDPRDVSIRPGRHRQGGRVGGVLPGEDDVVGREGFAVVPLHTLLQLHRDGETVASDLPVLQGRHLGRQNRHEVAVRVERDERLVEEARAVAVLHADRQVRVQDRGRLPPE